MLAHWIRFPFGAPNKESQKTTLNERIRALDPNSTDFLREYTNLQNEIESEKLKVKSKKSIQTVVSQTPAASQELPGLKPEKKTIGNRNSHSLTNHTKQTPPQTKTFETKKKFTHRTHDAERLWCVSEQDHKEEILDQQSELSKKWQEYYRDGSTNQKNALFQGLTTHPSQKDGVFPKNEDHRIDVILSGIKDIQSQLSDNNKVLEKIDHNCDKLSDRFEIFSKGFYKDKTHVLILIVLVLFFALFFFLTLF